MTTTADFLEEKAKRDAKLRERLRKAWRAAGNGHDPEEPGPSNERSTQGHSPETEWDARIAYLSRLRPLDYDRERQATAEQFGCRVSTVDNAVKALRPATEGSGTSLDLADAEPWPEPVVGAELLSDITAAVMSHVILPVETARAIALWAAFSYTLDGFFFAPRLLIKSPQKRCGKTTLLDVLIELCRRPLPASNITSAALFRTIEQASPTILLDEADTFMRDNEELRGLVNSGHRRSLAFVIRTVEVNGEHEPRKFSTWCAMAIAGIGRQHGTIEDRSIIIELRRKLPGESVTRLDEAARRKLQMLARKIRRWSDDHIGALGKADPEVPPGLNDRAADNWRPLLAIASVAGGDWPELARGAASKLASVSEKESAGELLLADLRSIFDESPTVDWLATASLLAKLSAMEERPWGEWSKGKPLTAQGLRSLLEPFRVYSSVSPDGKKRGFKRASFADTWARYLPNPESIRQSVKNPATARVSADVASVSGDLGADGCEMGKNPHECWLSDGLTDAEAGEGYEGEIFGEAVP